MVHAPSDLHFAKHAVKVRFFVLSNGHWKTLHGLRITAKYHRRLERGRGNFQRSIAAFGLVNRSARGMSQRPAVATYDHEGSTKLTDINAQQSSLRQPAVWKTADPQGTDEAGATEKGCVHCGSKRKEQPLGLTAC